MALFPSLPEGSSFYDILSFCGGPELLALGALSTETRALIDEEPALAWENLCAQFDIRQTGTRSRGRRKWRDVFLSGSCSNCLGRPVYVMNTSCGTVKRGGNVHNRTFALCADCLFPGCALHGLRRRYNSSSDALHLQTMLSRILAVRRVVYSGDSGSKEMSKRASGKRRSNQNLNASTSSTTSSGDNGSNNENEGSCKTRTDGQRPRKYSRSMHRSSSSSSSSTSVTSDVICDPLGTMGRAP